jgi:hypothetical protein
MACEKDALPVDAMHNGLVGDDGLNKGNIVDVRRPSPPDGRFAACAPALVDAVGVDKQEAISIREHVELKRDYQYVPAFAIAAVITNNSGALGRDFSA